MLKQAPKSWSENSWSWILKQGCVVSIANPFLFINLSYATYVFVYVYDLVIVGKLDEFCLNLKKEFNILHKGPLKKILGNHLIRDNFSELLHQRNHIETALSKLGVSNTKPISFPMTPSIKLRGAPKSKHNNFLKLGIIFCSSTGYLNFITSCTFPDLSYAFSNLSCFNTKPGINHWE